MSNAKNMKKILFSVLAVVAVACAPKTETVLSGNLPAEAGSVVIVNIPDLQLDTLVTLEDGAFELSLPVDVMSVGILTAGDYKAQFVPDGSALTVVWPAESEDLKVVSSSKKSVTSRMNEIGDWMDQFFENYANAEDKDAEFEKYVAKLTELVKNNPDNVLGLMGLQSLRGQIDAADMVALVKSTSSRVQEREEIVRLMAALDSAMSTAEGSMFTDFEVEQPDGTTLKLSDFVGNGKYVLVDFWASWCGPCRREIPYIKAAYDKYHSEKFDVLSVAVWDKPEDTARALAEENLPWPQIVNAQRIPTDIYGIQGIPHLILFGPDGRILKRGEGLRGENMDPVIGGFLAD